MSLQKNFAQKLFLRYLPLDLVAQFQLTTPVQEFHIAPLEPKQKEADELRGVRVEVNQGMAYHVAVIRGTDVDQPRNLAKSVTVE